MDGEIDLRDYLAIVWARRRIFAGTVILAVGVAALVSFLLPPTYVSSSVIHLVEDGDALFSNPESAVQVLSTESFLLSVAGPTGFPETGARLQRLVHAQALREARMVRIEVRYRNAQRAQELARGLTKAFVAKASVRIARRRRVSEARLNSVNAQLQEVERMLRLTRTTLERLQQGSQLSAEDRGFVRTFALNAMGISEGLYSGLRAAQRDLTLELLSLEPPAVVEPPILPVGPVAPRKALNVALGAVLGVVAGAILAFGVEYFRPVAPVVTQTTAAAATARPAELRRS